MSRRIIINEEQLSSMSRIDETIGGFMDKVRDAASRGKEAYQQDKQRNEQILRMRLFIRDLDDKVGTLLDKDLFKRVRTAVSRRIWQLQAINKSHGLRRDNEQMHGGKKDGNYDFYTTQKNLKEWKELLTRTQVQGESLYSKEKMGDALYNYFEQCLSMPYGREKEFFYILQNKIIPGMRDLSRRTGAFSFNA